MQVERSVLTVHMRVAVRQTAHIALDVLFPWLHNSVVKRWLAFVLAVVV
jgi:hypothetical protein